ncbi:MAG: hypothetical protein RMK91_05735 [Pseudanabaenaceae cyanobacterium SKYGB_i_bin29]|nr:hypothetical protein [Pseudanabaenaceae cyanobacterium SKYG29]MDW8421351.1 hypothetical protein [Pseudanabaenaceae cyanobacterium SKYGB_i_bin29]
MREEGVNSRSLKIDTSILHAAKQAYRSYMDAYDDQLPRPLGIAVNRYDLTGKLVFRKPILLPQESFVPIEVVESHR